MIFTSAARRCSRLCTFVGKQQNTCPMLVQLKAGCWLQAVGEGNCSRGCAATAATKEDGDEEATREKKNGRAWREVAAVDGGKEVQSSAHESKEQMVVVAIVTD